MNIAVIGSGYTGLVTGACFSDLGNRVVCIDNDCEKINKLKNGIVPIYEPGLEPLITLNMNEGRLTFTDSIEEGIKDSEVIFICVGTPPKENGEADLSSIENVASCLSKSIKGYKLIVEKSTVPVGTADWMESIIKKYLPDDACFDLAVNPEFLREGSAIYDFVHPDRIVIGASSEKAISILSKLYKPIAVPILIVDIKSAELIKYASNIFLSIKISFANGLARICDLAGCDIAEVTKGVGLDKRIGEDFLKAGVGYGGSCLPKDISAFIHISEKLGYDFPLLKATKEINETQRLYFIKKAEDAIGSLSGKTIGILGLSFKPDTDDIREAPSLKIIEILLKKGANIKAYDPCAIEKTRIIFPQITYCNDPYEVSRNSHLLMIITEWKEFSQLDLLRIKSLLKNPVIIDGRNMFEPSKMRNLGFIYKGIGR
ncbi:TPA: UDP-glucose 6-dehydrogenase [bacterium]|nr:UDP-glucose 6-dehydrogenase [bacterium]